MRIAQIEPDLRLELSELEYQDFSEDEEALINEGVHPDLDLAEQR